MTEHHRLKEARNRRHSGSPSTREETKPYRSTKRRGNRSSCSSEDSSDGGGRGRHQSRKQRRGARDESSVSESESESESEERERKRERERGRDRHRDSKERSRSLSHKWQNQKSRRKSRWSSEEDGESDSSLTGSDSGRERKSRRGRTSDKKRSSHSRKTKTKTKTKTKRKKKKASEEDESDSEKNHEDGSESSDGSEKEKKKKRKLGDEEVMEYLAKRAQKKALKIARKLKSEVDSGYSNDNNPFGDPNLTEKFVWRKKIERDLSKGIVPAEISLHAEKKRQKERMAEIEKVKKRREERAIEKAQHEEEMAMLARERARAEFQDWEKKEEEFHFVQSKVRSDIRLREGRAKPIDVLSKNLNLADDFDMEINEPYKIFKGLTVKEMEELQQDIKMYLELDRATPTHIEFWEAMMVVCNWEIAEARKRDALDRARVRGEEPPAELLAEERGLHKNIAVEIHELLQGKNFRELDSMQKQIEAEMRSGTAKLVEYWEAVLKHMHIFKAKARLKEIHMDLLQQYLQRLKGSEDKFEALPHEDESDGYDEQADDIEDAGPWSPKPLSVDDATKEAEQEPGSFSPALIHDDDDEADEAIDPEEDRAELERKRAEVVDEQQRRLQEAAEDPGATEDENMELTRKQRELVMKTMGAMEEGDAILGSSAEVNLESQVYWWHDKYRPRKPKYFNRVHTGYEWNKYNQTHYDHDNPPPKIVQGYKFNIFYPDLVDKSKAPQYFIEKDGSNGETCLIRFHAGPPYEDISFRIVNKEWEYSHKKGFKCTFERGILHVYFNFKRYRYRR